MGDGLQQMPRIKVGNSVERRTECTMPGDFIIDLQGIDVSGLEIWR
jgi:hypothetical protein